MRLGDYVFAGGISNRDYETVVAAARRLPHTEFVVVWLLPTTCPATFRATCVFSVTWTLSSSTRYSQAVAAS